MRKSVKQFIGMKKKDKKITMLSLYDYPMAKIADEAGVDSILVGDSMGNTMLGYDNPIPVKLDDIITHTKAVVRGSQKALVIADMPFMSYQAGFDQAVENCGRTIQATGAGAVKIEGATDHNCRLIKYLTEIGIPVCGHIGFTPQSFYTLGGYKVQGKTEEQHILLRKQAKRLEEAGCFGIVLEMIPAELAATISSELTIPTIGIGAGPDCDGQVLVLYDLLGIDADFNPRFLKKYANLNKIIHDAVSQYLSDVRDSSFPGSEHSF